jgi:hypothetical protein
LDEAEMVTREDYLAAWKATLAEVREQVKKEREAEARTANRRT